MFQRKPKVGSTEWKALALAREAACTKKKKLLHSRFHEEWTQDGSYFKSNLRDLDNIIEFVDKSIGENEGDDILDDYDSAT